MEYLSRLLKTLKELPNFNFHPNCNKLNIVQIGFADDLLLFCRGDPISVQMLYDYFLQFSKASGILSNQEKSSIYFGGVCPEDKAKFLEKLGFSHGELPFKYPGISLSTKRTTISQYKPLIDKIMEKVIPWTTKFLSYAGRLQLIKFVLLSVQVYWSQIFILPKQVVQQIVSLCGRFLWTGGVDMSRKTLVAWADICLPKVAGGMNVHVTPRSLVDHLRLSLRATSLD
ncbi:hypothetical protein KY289_010879 [Solanum tuberosum]|nr:hypothetical protein KY289_010879 [Solanum tuberosum]